MIITNVSDLLEIAGFELVGSRNLGLYKKDSDYDYMTTDSSQFYKLCWLMEKENLPLNLNKYLKDLYEQYPHLIYNEKELFASKQTIVDEHGIYDICLVDKILSKEEQIKLHREKYKLKYRLEEIEKEKEDILKQLNK